MKKQILIISYSLISIIFGLALAITYDSFEFLIPIALANMFTSFFLCRMEEKVNFGGMLLYLILIAVTCAVMFIIPFPHRMEALRLSCMKILSVMFVILGGLAGGILRYEFYRMERKKDKESEGYESKGN